MPKPVGFDPLSCLGFSDTSTIAQEKAFFIVVHYFFFLFKLYDWKCNLE